MDATISNKQFKGRMMVQGRDFVVSSYKMVEEDGRIIIGASSVEHPDCPPTKKYVRGVVEVGAWILTPNKQGSLVQYISQTDLKGKVPQSLVNMATKDQGLLVYSLRDALKKHYA